MSRLPVLVLAPIALRQAKQVRESFVRLPDAHGAKDGLVAASAVQGAGAGAASSGSTGRPLRLLVVGDSTAVGTGAATLDDALPGRLARLLAAGGSKNLAAGRSVAWRVVGQSGATSTEVLRDFADAAVAVHFDLAVVLVGWNDGLQAKSGGEFARSLGALLDRLHTGSPDARLVVVGPPAFSHFAILPNPLRWALGRHTLGLTRTSALVAREHGAVSAPGFDPRPDELAPDGFHPNPTGYQHLAEGIVAALADAR